MFNLKSLAASYDKAFGTVSKYKDKTTEFVGHGLQMVEVGGMTYALSYANGRSPAMGKDYHEISDGVPTDLALGAVGHVVAFLGGAGVYGEHLHNLADGAVAAWAARMGTKAGSQARLASGPSQQAAKGGWVPPMPAYSGAGNVAGYQGVQHPAYAGVG